LIDLYEEIYGLVRQIPPGKVSTPKDISEALGDTGAAKAVTETIEETRPSDILPVHRVVSREGRSLCSSLTRDLCSELLRQEGAEVVDGVVISFKKHLFNNFESGFPLKQLQKLQEVLASKVVLEDKPSKALKVTAGVDVAYKGRRCFGVCVLIDQHSRVLNEVESETEIRFPYIPSYLAFREGPVIMKTLEKMNEPFDTLIINGHGVAHPRGCGIATHIGIILGDRRTIGVATRRLLSRAEQGQAPYGDQIIKIQRAHHGTIYVSPGNNITSKKSLEVVETFLGEHRLPEPLWHAHVKARNLSRQG